MAPGRSRIFLPAGLGRTRVAVSVASPLDVPRAAHHRIPFMDALRQFRVVGHLEGVSFLLLLFVAMPLKYFAGWPLGVRVVGALHGLLFLAYLVALFRIASDQEWPLRRSAGAFIASILPFGFFVFDARVLGVDAGKRPVQ
jgi:integral membrane protein